MVISNFVLLIQWILNNVKKRLFHSLDKLDFNDNSHMCVCACPSLTMLLYVVDNVFHQCRNLVATDCVCA